MQFSAIQGYDTIKQRLIHMARTRQVPHAQLWGGPVGNANLPLALAFTTYLNCQNPQPSDACGQCASCTQMHKLVHPDVKFVFPVAATKQVAAKDAVSTSFMPSWRTFLQEQPYGTISDWGHYLGVENKLLSIAKEEAKHILQYVNLQAFGDAYQVLWLWLPEHMHPTAANALLKVIEEPPPRTLFLLISHQPDRVLATIRSRAQQISIPAFTDQALAES
ncbi:MAG: DNA polymerase III subunit delta, partial [Bacteroidota bacterium]